jgi:hypothetical protein
VFHIGHERALSRPHRAERSVTDTPLHGRQPIYSARPIKYCDIAALNIPQLHRQCIKEKIVASMATHDLTRHRLLGRTPSEDELETSIDDIATIEN